MGLLETNAITRLATVSSLDMSNVASAQTLYTVPATKESGAAVTGMIPTHFIFRSPTVALTTGQFCVGFNSTAYNDVLAAATHAGLTGSSAFVVLSNSTGARVGVPGDVLKCQFTVGQTTASTNTVAVEVLGLLF